jgi:uncharacterized protein YndB with AHSA1/START domain
MATPATAVLPPVRRDVVVSWNQEAAFQRFTRDFASWWPSSTHSIGASQVQRVVFECRQGGRIFEELKDGRRFQWGVITAWEPPRQVSFTWHPSRDEREAQDVTVTFTPQAGGTKVELVSTGWEKLGTRAARERKGYAIGWGSILDVFAGKRSFVMLLFAAISKGTRLYLKLTGKLEAEINKSGGRMVA